MLVLLAMAAALAGPGDLLANGSFEEARRGAPVGWSTSIGATTGSGNQASELSLDEAALEGQVALRLTGDATTVRWTSVDSDPVPVAPGDHVRLSGWMRTEAVRKEGRQFENCYLGAVFVDRRGDRVEGALHAVGFLAGTTDWTELSGVLVAPPGAAAVRVLLFLSMSGSAWFDDIRLEQVPPPDWQEVRGDRFTFRYLPEAPITEDDRRFVEDRLAWTEAQLGLTYDAHATFVRYPDTALKADLTGVGGNAHYDGNGTIHTVWPTDTHEVVHMIVGELGYEGAAALLQEGLAVHLSEAWHGEPVHDWTRRYHRAGMLPSVVGLLADWRSSHGLVSYPVAGSFVGWLVETHGMARFLEAYVGAEEPRARLERVYGLELGELEAAWLAAVVGPGAHVADLLVDAFPELEGARLAREVTGSVAVSGSDALRLPSDAAWTLRDEAGAVVAEGTDRWIARHGLPVGRFAVSAEGRTATIEARAPPYTQISVLDLQADGAIAFRSIAHRLHPGPQPLSSHGLMASDFVHYERITDEQGRELALEVQHDPGRRVFHHVVRLPEPVEPGGLLVTNASGRQDPRLLAEADGMWTYEMTQHPNATLPTRNIEVFRLPVGAELLSSEGLQVRERDGRIELAQVGWVAPMGSVATRFTYRLR